MLCIFETDKDNAKISTVLNSPYTMGNELRKSANFSFAGVKGLNYTICIQLGSAVLILQFCQVKRQYDSKTNNYTVPKIIWISRINKIVTDGAKVKLFV